MTRTTTRVTTRTAPDRPTQQLAMWLDIMAGEVATARHILTERLERAIEGSSGSHGNTERVHTCRGTSTTETRALAALFVDEQLTELLDRIDGIRIAIRSTRHWINTELLRGHDIPAEPDGPAQCDQHGKAGNIEWGDPTCTWPADKAGLCSAHYQAWRRYRVRHNINADTDTAAA